MDAGSTPVFSTRPGNGPSGKGREPCGSTPPVGDGVAPSGCFRYPIASKDYFSSRMGRQIQHRARRQAAYRVVPASALPGVQSIRLDRGLIDTRDSTYLAARTRRSAFVVWKQLHLIFAAAWLSRLVCFT